MLIVAIVLGYLLRLVLMPTAGYGDLHAIAYALHLLAFQGETKVYSAIRALPEEAMPVSGLPVDFFPYPPLTYLVLGGAMTLLRPLYGDLFAASVVLPYEEFMATRPWISVWLFLYKLPLLAADLGMLAVFYQLRRETIQRLRLCAVWALNPIPIIVTYLFGQFDILPALFLLLAVWASSRGREGWAAGFLGVSAAFKIYSLLLIPIFAVVVARRLGPRLRAGFLASSVFLLSFVPLGHDPLLFEAVFGSDLVQQAAASGVSVGEVFEHTGILSLVLLSYAFLFLFAERRAGGNPGLLRQYVLAAMLLAYGFTFSHLQWFIGAAALLVLDWDARPADRPVQILLITSALIVAASWQVGGFFDFFRPVTAHIPFGYPSIWDLLPDPIGSAVVGAARSGLAGATLFWVYVTIIRPSAVDERRER